jgi:hypothetical protein
VDAVEAALSVVKRLAEVVDVEALVRVVAPRSANPV